MKRFNLYSSVPDLAAGIRICSELFGAESNTHCCQAVSDKRRERDPPGIAWQGLQTLDAIALDQDDGLPADAACSTPAATDAAQACCAPATAGAGACCCEPAAEVPATTETACCAPASDTGSAKSATRAARGCCGG